MAAFDFPDAQVTAISPVLLVRLPVAWPGEVALVPAIVALRPLLLMVAPGSPGTPANAS